MYDVFAYICLIFMVDAGRYTIHYIHPMGLSFIDLDLLNEACYTVSNLSNCEIDTRPAGICLYMPCITFEAGTFLYMVYS